MARTRFGLFGFYIWVLLCGCILLFAQHADAQSSVKPNKGQKKNAVSSAPHPKSNKKSSQATGNVKPARQKAGQGTKSNPKNAKPARTSKAKGTEKNTGGAKPSTASRPEGSKKNTGGSEPARTKKGPGTDKNTGGSTLRRDRPAPGSSQNTGGADPQDNGRAGAKRISKKPQTVAKTKSGATRRAKDNAGQFEPYNNDNAGKRDRTQNSNAVSTVPNPKKEKHDGKNKAWMIEVPERGSKKAKEIQGMTTPQKINDRGEETRKAMQASGLTKTKVKRSKGMKDLEGSIPMVEVPIQRKPNKELQSLVIEVPVSNPRKQAMQAKREHDKLMYVPYIKPKGLPKGNPVEYEVITERQIRKAQKGIAEYQGNIRIPTIPHQRRLAMRHSRMILNHDGKLNIAKPANGRKEYRKLGREIANYQGDLRIKNDPHHRHPSLARMERRHKPSSAEAWRARKLPKKPEYDPGERKIWTDPQKNNSTLK